MNIQSTPFPGKLRNKKGKMEADEKPPDPERVTTAKEASMPLRRQKPKNVFERLASSGMPPSSAKTNTTGESPPVPKKPTVKITRPKTIRGRRDAFSSSSSLGKPQTQGKEDAGVEEEAIITNEEGVVSLASSVIPENSSAPTPSLKIGKGKRIGSKNNKKVCFPQEVSVGSGEGRTGLKDKEDEDGLRTPLQKLQLSHKASSSSRKSSAGGTPYHSAENCSKCKIHRLETSSYWLLQIRLAESAEKHFVAATFFGLAHQCKAQPVRSLLMELKRYLGRHTWLYEETEWKSVALCYGLLLSITEDSSSVDVPGSLDFKAGDESTVGSEPAYDALPHDDANDNGKASLR